MRVGTLFGFAGGVLLFCGLIAPCTAAQQATPSAEPLSFEPLTCARPIWGRSTGSSWKSVAELLRWNGGWPAAHCQKASLWAWMEFLSGNPSESGDFHFIVTVSDSDHPAHQRNQELALRVLAPRKYHEQTVFAFGADFTSVLCRLWRGQQQQRRLRWRGYDSSGLANS